MAQPLFQSDDASSVQFRWVLSGSHDEVTGEHTSLRLSGRIEGIDLAGLAEVLTRASRQVEHTLVIDLRGLDAWSVRAQAMVLTCAQRLARRSARMVFYSPSPALRRQSTALGVFEFIQTLDPPPTPRRRSLTSVSGDRDRRRDLSVDSTRPRTVSSRRAQAEGAPLALPPARVALASWETDGGATDQGIVKGEL
ncbi:STAS domain-containing protein [Aeromicrobium sp.]|uniref:STAS domain-containing protein n=1 Tax=Aeromicrobium sp. TaxID=1871063 RepID=UPI003C59EFB7